MSVPSNKILIAFYGDDFTGSSDALEFLSRAGAKTILFIEPPTAQQLARYPGLDAIGVAGMTRSMTPSDMEKVLQPAFKSLKALGARHVHYKVCSTFDSSPEIGSIGKAVDIGMETFPSGIVPLLVAAPALGRYCIFGNLFARMGIGSNGPIFRLDRHPSMSKHPVTPSGESDLRLHLSRQTKKTIALIDILQVVEKFEVAKEIVNSLKAKGAEIILIDALYETQLQGIGELIDSCADNCESLFSVGSSGIEMALGKFWQEKGILKAQQYPIDAGEAETLLVISGSCSLVTSRQIQWALANDFAEVLLNTSAIASGSDPNIGISNTIDEVVSIIGKGRSVIIHTSSGTDDPRLKEVNSIFAAKGFTPAMVSQQTSMLFGSALGAIVLGVASRTTLKRLVIAGGDTSGYAARAMKIEAVEMICELSPGAPLCKAHAPGSALDGLELTIKGGQVGSDDYFGMVRRGQYSAVQPVLTNN